MYIASLSQIPRNNNEKNRNTRTKGKPSEQKQTHNQPSVREAHKRTILPSRATAYGLCVSDISSEGCGDVGCRYSCGRTGVEDMDVDASGNVVLLLVVGVDAMSPCIEPG